jgi:trehalose-phosphatase
MEEERMIHLFQAWGEVEPRIREARSLFLLLDYDGTLTPIVSRPELAVCPPEVKSLLEKLRDSPKSQVAIISGRALEDLKEKVGVSGITYVGNHGLEMENPAGVHQKKLSPQRQEELGQIRKHLETRLNSIPGIYFEDKGPILALHHRNAPRGSGSRVQTAVEEALAGSANRWQISTGKKIFEIHPRIEFDKGKTVRELLDRSPGARPFPVYLGDDRSDEDAFLAIRDRGISIFVGREPGSSAASFFLQDPAEVLDFLRRCEEVRRN